MLKLEERTLLAYLKRKIIKIFGGKFNTNFEVDKINLYLMAGKPKQWKLVKKFKLH